MELQAVYRFDGLICVHQLIMSSSVIHCRCPWCPRGADYSLQTEVRRMNVHIKTFHSEESLISREEFEALDKVMATKSGIKKSFVEQCQQQKSDNGFRSESLFEARVGMLKSCFFYDGEEERCLVNVTFLCRDEEKNVEKQQLHDSVIAMFARADALCKAIGSTMVRHQVMRNAENQVTPKVFHPVTKRTAHRYATHVMRPPNVVCQII